MGMNEIMRQAQQLQKKISEIQEQMANQTVQASAGGGMVTVTANGSQEITNIEIDPSVIDPDDLSMLQDLVVAATNEALKKAKSMVEEEMSKVTGGFKIPGMGGMM